MISFVIFILGLVIGSFLNAVIFRLEKGESALKGRSYCPHCKHSLSWQDLIPVLSFVFLKGHCRYCAKKISLQYPLVELATAVIFAFIGLNFYLLVIASLLIILFVYDLRYYILPVKILFPAIIIVILFRIFEFVKFENWQLNIENVELLMHPLFAGILAAFFFFAIFWISRGRAMGFGDVKLALFMGFFLSWPNILVALFVAFTAGAIIGIALIALQKKGLKSEIPFGPFLIAGTFIALFLGDYVVGWYTTFLS